jgi:hypothetical protein
LCWSPAVSVLSYDQVFLVVRIGGDGYYRPNRYFVPHYLVVWREKGYVVGLTVGLFHEILPEVESNDHSQNRSKVLEAIQELACSAHAIQCNFDRAVYGPEQFIVAGACYRVTINLIEAVHNGALCFIGAWRYPGGASHELE